MTTSPSSPAEAKALLRKSALARRAAMDPVKRVEASLALAELIDDLNLPPDAVVAGFWPIREEIDPRPLLDRLRIRGHRLCLPVVADPRLIFRVFDRETEFEPSGFGTMAPGSAALEVLPDVLLMPLAAYDRAGNRIGYGKGHYDTAITAIEKQRAVLCIGLAFEAQEVDHIPAEPHDKRLDGVLTEGGFGSFSDRT